MHAHCSPARRAGAVLTIAATTLLVSGCGDGGSSHRPAAPAGGQSMGTMSPPSAIAVQPRHNAQDVAFARSMIPHHRQALVLAGLAAKRAGAKAVRDLAMQIEKTQKPEITMMSAWLTRWGRQMPKGMPGHLPGMMRQADLARLKKLPGPRFDTAFLTMMIAHHQGAIAMARTEQAKGSYGHARRLAASIIIGQSIEIMKMRQLLGK